MKILLETALLFFLLRFAQIVTAQTSLPPASSAQNKIESTDSLVLNYHLMHPGGDSLPGDPNAASSISMAFIICTTSWLTRGKGKTSFSFVHVTSPDMLHWTWQPTKLQPSFTGHGMFSGTGFLTKEGKARRHLSRPGIGPEPDRRREGSEALGLGEAVSDRCAKRRRHGGEDQPLGSRLLSHWRHLLRHLRRRKNPPVFKSKDLKTWTLVGDFLQHDMPDVAHGEDISCPNFFPSSATSGCSSASAIRSDAATTSATGMRKPSSSSRRHMAA